MKLNLQNEVTSLQDLKSVILEIEKCAGWLSQNQVKAKVSGKTEQKTPTISQAADDLIKQWHAGQPVTAKSLDELAKALKDFGSIAPRMTITLAAPAPATLKKELVGWCRKNLDPQILVDFKFNSTMLGGMAVQYGSHLYDWSFRRQILAGKDKFAEVLRRV
jgi:hypothetical protein